MWFSSIIASALVATTVAADFTPYFFKIQTINKNRFQNGYNQYLSSFQVGPKIGTLVGTTDVNQALSFYINTTANSYLSSYNGTQTNLPVALVGLVKRAPTYSDAPAGYNYVSKNYGDFGTQGFLTTTKNTVEYSGDLFNNGPVVRSFALCLVNGTDPHPELGQQYQFFWAPQGSRASTSRCADVTLKVIPV